MYKLKILFILFFFTFAPYMANACSVCSGSLNDAEIKAYVFITVLLLLIPIVSFIFLSTWIYKKYKNHH